MVGLRLQQAIVTLLSRQLPCLDLVRDWARNRNLKVVLTEVIVELLGKEPPTKGLVQCKGTGADRGDPVCGPSLGNSRDGGSIWDCQSCGPAA